MVLDDYEYEYNRKIKFYIPDTCNKRKKNILVILAMLSVEKD